MSKRYRRRLALHLALIGIMAEFLLSGRVLAALGIPYSDEGGPLVAKLHPGTYLSICAVAARLASGVTPFDEAWRLASREQMLALYLCAILYCVVDELLFTGTGGIVLLIEVYLPAALIGFSLADLTSSEAACLTRLLQVLFMLNASLALVEAIAGAHIVPAANTSQPVETDNIGGPGAEFRPVALYDHPLTGGTATLIGLLLYPDRRHSPLWCTAYMLCMFVALLAFGGRIALALGLCAGTWLYAGRIAKRGYSGTLAPVDVGPLVAVVGIALPLAGMALTSGLASRLMAHLYWDASAQTRIAEFRLIGLLRPDQLLFGCRRDDMIALLKPMELAFGVDAIENFWLVMFIMLGALGFAAFVPGIASLFWWLWHRGNRNTHVMLTCFIIATSSSNSLGHKSPLLVMLVAAVIARTPTTTRRRTGAPGRNAGLLVTAAVTS
jgi:hypothetical protein